MLQSRIPQLVDSAVRKANEAAEDTAEAIAREAKRRVAVQSGATRDSIEATSAVNGEAKVEVGHFVGTFLEFGTSKAAAQPFLIPSTEAEKGDFLRRLKRIV